MSADMSDLSANNTALQGNLSALQAQQAERRQELDMHYQQFLDMRTEIQRLNQENLALRKRLATLERTRALDQAELSATGGNMTEIVQRNEALQMKVASLENRQKNGQVMGGLEREELDQRYKQYVGMREDISRLRGQRSELLGELSHLRAGTTSAHQA